MKLNCIRINKQQNILINIGIGLFFLYIPYIFTFEGLFGFPNLLHNLKDRFDIFINVLILAFLFFNYYYLYDKLFVRKKKLLYFLIVVVFSFLIYASTHHYFHAHRRSHHKENEKHNKVERRRHRPNGLNSKETVFLFIAGLLASTFFRSQNRYKQLEQEKTKSELLYIKSQINPHFLFNTLNSIYAQSIKENASNTSESILKLSAIMRYITTEADEQFVYLEQELFYIKDYIELQKLRLDNNNVLNFKITGDAKNKKIVPLLLISFIENVFKHGVSPDETSTLNIKIDITDTALTLYTSNNKVHSQQDTIEKSGIGIKNTKHSLELMYPSKHSLVIRETDTEFVVDLKIQLV